MDLHKREWYSAMQDEINSFHADHTSDLMKLLKGKRALRNKWVFKLKIGEYGCPLIYKSHIVVKGFKQNKVGAFDVLRLLANMNLEIE